MKTKTLQEAAEELKMATDRFSEARRNFMRAYVKSVQKHDLKMTREYLITYNKAEDGLPKWMIEDSDWN